jgi:hypothetical protein
MLDLDSLRCPGRAGGEQQIGKLPRQNGFRFCNGYLNSATLQISGAFITLLSSLTLNTPLWLCM